MTRRARDEDNEKGKAYRVAVATASGQEQRIVHVGLQTRTQAEVTDGLQPGERILVSRPQGSPTATAQTNAQRGNAGRFNRGPQL